MIFSRRQALPIKGLIPDFIPPVYSTEMAAGLDLHAQEYQLIHPGQSALVSLGFSIAIPEDMAGLLMSRSGHARVRVSLANSVGLIDPDYRGQVMAVVVNDGMQDFEILRGSRIAQLAIVPAPQFEIQLADELPPAVSSRVGGFGSTGA